MKRIVVCGGTGFFGGAAVERLRADGLSPVVASRRGELSVDVENPASIRAALRPGDVAIDCVGPFQARSTTLVEAAMEIGFDVVDIADSFDYVERVYALAPNNIRVLTACSSISAISATMVRMSGIREPVRLSGLLKPAAKYAASPATSESLVRSVGRPIWVRREGRLVSETGWRGTRDFEGAGRGHLFESADAITLPKVWPTLRTVDFYVDSNVPMLNAVLTLSAMSGFVQWLVNVGRGAGLAFSRMFGSGSGMLAYEVEGADGKVFRAALAAKDRGYFTPIVPAVLAARAIAEDRFPHTGLIPPDRHVEPDVLFEYLRSIGVEFVSGAL